MAHEQKVTKSAETGQFVSHEEAERSPATTYEMTVVVDDGKQCMFADCERTNLATDKVRLRDGKEYTACVVHETACRLILARQAETPAVVF